MQSYIISIEDTNLKLHLYREELSLREIADVFVIFKEEFRVGFSVGEFIDLLDDFDYDGRILSKVVQSPMMNRVVYDFELKQVRVIERGKVVFNDSLSEFQNFVKGPEEKLLGKTVVFRYTGGSGIGNRVVKVEKIEKKNGSIYICGQDLVQSGVIGEDQYRCYDKRKIDGEIIVIEDGKAVEV